jgi:uncharacterized protein (TIGR02145 family)
LEVRWDWNGDGIWDTDYSKTKTNTHLYTSPGSYSVILEVKDESGLADTETKTVNVADGTFTDSRDEHEYTYKTIGTQTWMAENLNYNAVNSYCYDNNSSNCLIYGRLYTRETAKTACPFGWHLPSGAEWTTLTDYLGTPAGGKMKETGTTHWLSPNAGATNESGFTALPGGKRYNGAFDYLGASAYFSQLDGHLVYGDNNVHSGGGVDASSIRCLRSKTVPTASFTFSPYKGTTLTNFLFDASGCTDGETVNSDLVVRWDWNGDGTWDTGYDKTKTNSHQYASPGSYSVILEVKDESGLVDTETKTVIVAGGNFTDSRDGHEYFLKTIGTQTWMAENLAYLPSVSPSSVGSETSPYWYVYNYQGSNVTEAKSTANYTTYGVLYNWESAKTACPSGWHLPSDTEWTTLTDFLGTSAGGKMKETGTTHWLSPNAGATNESVFTALPGGCLIPNGSFSYLGSYALFWSASKSVASFAWYRGLCYNDDEVGWHDDDCSYGFSVRCIKD